MIYTTTIVQNVLYNAYNMSDGHQLSKNYGHCICNICRGAIRRRTTITAHKHSSRHQQINMRKQDRICHCSMHRLGAIVHRNTKARHKKDDKERRVVFELPTDEILPLDLMDIPEDDPDAFNNVLADINALRSFAQVTEMPVIWADEPTEEEEEDEEDYERLEDEGDTNELDQEEEMDDIEDAAETEELPAGFANEKLELFIDWVHLMTPLTRSSRQNVKSFFERRFPHIELPSIWRLEEKLQKITGIEHQWIDCCINSCVAYTGRFEGLDHCPFPKCKQARYYKKKNKNGSSRARKQYLYIPIAPR
ncbi:hypothetical protein F4804DRAFT_228339, partial [Jackrogersella minutella]